MWCNVLALQPGAQLVWLVTPDKGCHVHLDRLCHAVAGAMALAVLNPPLCGKVGRLCNVEAMIETRVVSVGEDDDDGARLVHHLDDGNTMELQHLRRHECDLVAEEGGAEWCDIGKELLGSALQQMPVLGWHAVPRLGCPIVQEVDGVEVHVLHMPGKGGLPHAKVQVRRVDTKEHLVCVLLDVA